MLYFKFWQFFKAAGGERAKWEPVWGRFHISGRLGEMAEVAAAVTFLASADATFINATDLKVRNYYTQEWLLSILVPLYYIRITKTGFDKTDSFD